MTVRRRGGDHNQAAIWGAPEVRYVTLNLAGIADVYRAGLNPERGCYGLNCAN